MDGNTVVRRSRRSPSGAQVDTGAYESTQTGLFHVYNKTPDLSYDPPYKTYISDWVGFDPAKANGFHSFLKDKDGTVVDPRYRTHYRTAAFAPATRKRSPRLPKSACRSGCTPEYASRRYSADSDASNGGNGGKSDSSSRRIGSSGGR